MKKVVLSGVPNFTTISDEKLDRFVDLFQEMIFAYKRCDPEKARVMSEVWKDLSDERTDRLCNSPFVTEESPELKTHKIKMVKRIKR